jgi:hypothetical protein
MKALGWREDIAHRQRQRSFPLASVSSPALGPTQPPVQWVPGDPFPGGKVRLERDADQSPHLAPRSRMSSSYISSLPCACMAVEGQLYVYFYTNYR